MIQAILVGLVVATLSSSSSGPGTIAKYYGPGVMERVAHNRGIPIFQGAHLASTPDCGRIGQLVAAKVNGHLATYLVVDCSRPGADRERHLREGLVLEVDYGSAMAYFPPGEGRAPAQVLGFRRRR